jgi:hypothetical protein
MLEASARRAVALVEGYAIVGEAEEDLVARLVQRNAEGYRFQDRSALRRPGAGAANREWPNVDAVFTCDLAWSWLTAREIAAAATQKAWRRLDRGSDAARAASEIAFLRQHSKIPIGIGDEATRVAELEGLMDGGCVDVLRVDATTIGGFSAALALAEQATRRGFRVSYHVNPEIHRHCIFANDAVDHIEIFPADRPFDCSHVLIDDPSFGTIRGGIVSPPEAPGTGLHLSSDALSRFAYRHSLQRQPPANKVAFITGGARGIGWGDEVLARRLVVDRRHRPCRGAAPLFGRSGKSSLPLDVSECVSRGDGGVA